MGKKALLVHGAPGIGKTTAAHLAAKSAGYSPLELNASDVRSKKLIESTTNIDNTSIDTFFGNNNNDAINTNVTHSTCLIFDECDGMSAGDRGGIGAMNALIKKTRIPIICICNDKSNPKMRPFQNTCGDILFRRPEASQIRSRIMSILHKEKMKLDSNVVDQLISGSQSDIRQVINMISTWKLLSNTMNYDQGKELSEKSNYVSLRVQDNQKFSIQTPWTVMSNLFSPHMFGPTNQKPLAAKADYYFHDHSLIPLFVQENYVKCNPVKARDSDHNRSEFNRIKCLSDAADAISDGDLVDSMIHGSQQQWSLMPIHAIHSTVRPASFMYGGFKSGYGRDTISFPAWLGQYSKTNKYNRALGDIQARMRLKISGEANEIRQYYYPTLWPSLYKPLIETNPDYEKVIGLLDEYFLSKDEFDIMSELGLDRLSIDNTMKLIPTKNKSAFTRQWVNLKLDTPSNFFRSYNNRDHPIPFSKGQVVKASAAQIKTEKPDHEDVYDDDDVVVDLKEDDENENEDGDDVLDDKLIKQPKKSSAAKTSTRGRTTTTSKRGRGRGSTTKK
ncbi:DNA replication factor C, large subunit [Wallemia mellicola]|nr:DNA replication factor C, large subunit [Wallemia mellicola]